MIQTIIYCTVGANIIIEFQNSILISSVTSDYNDVDFLYISFIFNVKCETIKLSVVICSVIVHMLIFSSEVNIYWLRPWQRIYDTQWNNTGAAVTYKWNSCKRHLKIKQSKYGNYSAYTHKDVKICVNAKWKAFLSSHV